MKFAFITTWDNFQNQIPPTDAAEEQDSCSDLVANYSNLFGQNSENARAFPWALDA